MIRRAVNLYYTPSQEKPKFVERRFGGVDLSSTLSTFPISIPVLLLFAQPDLFLFFVFSALADLPSLNCDQLRTIRPYLLFTFPLFLLRNFLVYVDQPCPCLISVSLQLMTGSVGVKEKFTSRLGLKKYFGRHRLSGEIAPFSFLAVIKICRLASPPGDGALC